MLGQCHDNQETKTCFDIVETTSTSRQKLSSYGLEHEKKIFSLVDPLKIIAKYCRESNTRATQSSNVHFDCCHELFITGAFYS